MLGLKPISSNRRFEMIRAGCGRIIQRREREVDPLPYTPPLPLTSELEQLSLHDRESNADELSA